MAKQSKIQISHSEPTGEESHTNPNCHSEPTGDESHSNPISHSVLDTESISLMFS